MCTKDNHAKAKVSCIDVRCKNKKESIREAVVRLVYVDGLAFDQNAKGALISSF